jgi:hypothetical protein
MNFKEYYLKEDNEITDEMIDWFNKRTTSHIDLVKKYAKKIEEYNPKRFKGLIKQTEDHDKLKFEEPERTPYIKLSWKHKQDNYKSYKKPGTINDEEINNATLHHILNSPHHPEAWQNKKDGLVNKDNRDKPPKEIVDATKMPDINIAEMLADWMAMSEELKKNTTKEWADQNIGVRWKFTDDQKDLIYELIDNIKGEQNE